MNRRLAPILVWLSAAASVGAETPAGVHLAIHGGAGTIRQAEMTAEREAEYRTALAEALRAGHTVLAAGGSALDAVEAVVRLMEDSPLFNAGKGAVFTAEGTNELDASIMDGSTRRAGAVAVVRRIKNPISAARAVMERTPHVLLAGEAAERLAAEAGLELVDPSYFYTERRWQDLQKEKAKSRGQTQTQGAHHESNADDVAGALSLDPDAVTGRLATRPGAVDPTTAPDPVPAPAEPTPRRVPAGVPSATDPPSQRATNDPPMSPSDMLGTVGAVARDRQGRLAAATSTGGRTNKLAGRIGDTPLVGAGTYADSACAVSGTGHGEYFIRYVVAHDICARARDRGIPLAQAAREVVHEVLEAAGGEAGVIALDAAGNAVLTFNTEGMYRGWIGPDGVAHVAIYGE